MIPNPLSYHEIPDIGELEVVYEVMYQEGLNSQILTALIPARVSKTKEGYVRLTMVRFVKHDPYFQFSVYDKDHFPALHKEERLDVAPRLYIAAGGLLLWDKNTDKTVKTDLHWWDPFPDPWFSWNNDTQSYSNEHYFKDKV